MGGSRKGLQVVYEVVRTLQKIIHGGDHPDPGLGRVGGTSRRRSTWRCWRGGGTSRGMPHPGHRGRFRRFFDSLAGVAVTGKGVLDKLVKSNAFLAITIATLADTNACLSKKLEMLTATLAKKGGGRGEVPVREPGKCFPNCKRETWHKPD